MQQFFICLKYIMLFLTGLCVESAMQGRKRQAWGSMSVTSASKFAILIKIG